MERKARNVHEDERVGLEIGAGCWATKALLLAILAAYEECKESELATQKLGIFLTSRFGSVSKSKAKLGGFDAINDAFRKRQETFHSD